MFCFFRRAAWRRLVTLLLLAVAFFPISPGATGVTAATRRPLVGHVPGGLARLQNRGPVAADQRLTLTFALRPRDPAGLARAAATPGGRLGVADVAARYGQSDAAIQALAGYLAGYGLTVGAASPDHLSLEAVGTVDQIQRALSVNLTRFVDGRGRQVYSTTVDPQLPVPLADSVEAIFGLENVLTLQPLHQQIPPRTIKELAGSQPGFYTPADLRAAYDLGPLYSRGLNGTSQTIAIIGCDGFSPSDIQSFSTLYGLPGPSISVVNVDGGATETTIETTLDLEWSHAIAPNASLRFYGFPQCSLQGFLDAVTAASNEHVAHIVSISLGACESDYAQTSYFNAMESQFQAAAVEGISVLAASGDSGAYCAASGGAIGVIYPAASPYVTAVGGTSLTLNSSGGYGSETAWGYWQNGTQPWGSGGGYSGVTSEPSWQSQAGISDATGKRAIPDVAWNADPYTGNCVYFQGGLQCGWGGTSIAAPQWAGLIAMADQAGGSCLGLLGPTLYGSTLLGSQSGSSAAYHDVTGGNNLKYSAGPGWDAATGWGSPDGSNLIGVLYPQPQPPNGKYRVYLPMVAKSSAPC